MAKAWSRQEVAAAVEDYFSMLPPELRGEPYGKTAHRRKLLDKLGGRSAGAVERKHQNISAILLELGLPYIDGYKPLANYQTLLKEAVEDHLADNPHLIDALSDEDERPIIQPPAEIEDPSSVLRIRKRISSLTAPGFPREIRPKCGKLFIYGPLVDPPEPSIAETKASRAQTARKPQKYDFTGREARNGRLGKAGEKFVLAFERARLREEGRPDLTQKIEWVSETQGDGAGYDIRSFDSSGEHRYIEVKTTNYGPSFPFFVSGNELSFSRENAHRLLPLPGFQFLEITTALYFARQTRRTLQPGTPGVSGHGIG